ncbi:MAG TPA: glycosyltransferase family 2 protein [Methanocella sp.]|uniref:glycosyltransferase family 2 protein n=1 Tax=Methanocella sp. TaxID=2052833 RepID=UPI002C2B3716|nr:glycosyltransferase family 2 protein [Methanocella sp.]HTY90879.1 glycosyltransferase family 2 protein [Methanocella sp.]
MTETLIGEKRQDLNFLYTPEADIPGLKLASVIILAYNSFRDLCECLPTIMRQTRRGYEVIVPDNSSSNDTCELIKNNYKDVRLIDNGANLGYPAGNNRGFQYARGKYIVIVNPDVVVDDAWLDELVKPLEKDPRIAITTSKILMYGADKINTCANHIHFSGLGFCRGLKSEASSYDTPEVVGAMSGCSFAIRREAFEDLAGFDPDFFLYLEDTDLSLRARLRGYRIQYVPTSIVYHKYRMSLTPAKEFYLERNRHMLLLKNYGARTLLLMFPALLMTEAVTWGYAVLHGLPYVREKLRAYWWMLTHLGDVMEKRRRVQQGRKISDREFIGLLEWRIPFEQLIDSRPLCRFADLTLNNFYRLYFTLIKKLV